MNIESIGNAIPQTARILSQATQMAPQAAAPSPEAVATGVPAVMWLMSRQIGKSSLADTLLAPGTHVDLVGAFKPDMDEADPASFGRSRIFVDAYDAVLEEAGDLLQAMAGGQVGRDDILGDLHALCSGRVLGRKGDDDITLFKSVGVSIEDLVAAELVLQTCRGG